MFIASDLIFYLAAIFLAVKVRNHWLWISIMIYIFIIFIIDYHNVAFILVGLMCDIWTSTTDKSRESMLLTLSYFICYTVSVALNAPQYSILVLGFMVLFVVGRLIFVIRNDSTHKNQLIHILAWGFPNISLSLNIVYSMIHKESMIQGINIFFHINLVILATMMLSIVYTFVVIKLSSYLTLSREIMIYALLLTLNIMSAFLVDGVSMRILISPVYAVGTFIYAYSLYKYPLPKEEDIEEALDISPEAFDETTPILLQQDHQNYVTINQATDKISLENYKEEL